LSRKRERREKGAVCQGEESGNSRFAFVQGKKIRRRLNKKEEEKPSSSPNPEEEGPPCPREKL